MWLQIWDAGGENSLSNLFLSFLFQKREIFQDLAPLLWHSFGTVAALLQVGYSYCTVLNSVAMARVHMYLCSSCYLSKGGCPCVLIISIWNYWWFCTFSLFSLSCCFENLCRRLCQFTLHFHLLLCRQLHQTVSAMHLHFFRYAFTWERKGNPHSWWALWWIENTTAFISCLLAICPSISFYFFLIAVCCFTPWDQDPVLEWYWALLFLCQVLNISIVYC